MIVGLSAEHFSIQPAYAFRWICFVCDIRASSQLAGLLDDERAVHHEQRLLWHGCDESLAAGRVWPGEVKRAKQPGKILPVDIRIPRPPRDHGLGQQVDRSTADSQVDLSRSGEQRVAHRLEIQAPGV